MASCLLLRATRLPRSKGRRLQELIEETERRDFKGGRCSAILSVRSATPAISARPPYARPCTVRDKLREGIARAQQEGSFRSDMAAKDMADFLVNVWQGALLRMKIERPTGPMKQCCVCC